MSNVRLPTTAACKAVLKNVSRLLQLANTLESSPDEITQQVRRDLDVVRSEIADSQLRAMPVKKIREVTEGRLRLGLIEDAGILSLADVLNASQSRLELIPGVGPETARKAVAAARQIRSLLITEARVRLDPDGRPQAHGDLLAGVDRYERIQNLRSNFASFKIDVARVEALREAALVTGSFWKRTFAAGTRKAEAAVALNQLSSGLSALGGIERFIPLEGQIRSVLHGSRPLSEVWDDYQHRSVEFWGVLGEITDLTLESSPFGFMPQEIVELVHSQDLDPSFLRVSLRGYQAFGAKFALVQRKVIIGDEMGLGKTIEALAVMGHLRSAGEEHFLVVCPASVIINWTQEVGRRTKLPNYRLHGGERDWAFERWLKKGGVAVTTFGTLGALPQLTEESRISLLVIDEAHYIKNPNAKRTTAVQSWAPHADRILYLTGTPMENRVEEFESLVQQLNPQVARTLQTKAGVAGASAFRKAVAPVYLRRNQEDVLSELPELLATDDWVELSQTDFRTYRDSVARGNFMSMRQAAYMNGGAESAKLKRLLEIIEESASNDWKVVVFSYFRGVLDKIHSTLDGLGAGIIHGGVRPVDRQAMVDAFSERRGPAVLVSQIEAGGVGLNMQAASVVILAEPQWKPTIEAQAIARCHRMGQTRRVHAHRLLAKDYVDQRMLEILGTKAELFDEYVRASALKDATPDAIDISETEAARKIVQMEQERLGLATP
ncbi:MAG: DEAD/DEAH box helicase [Actinomycetota bacterium]|nr:DEAD/DEAH box helicase family protein [Actinomycetota bacterium]